jgi:hypothetical protein
LVYENTQDGFMLRFLALIVKASKSWWLRICFGVMFLSCSQNLSSRNLSWDDLANACKIQLPYVLLTQQCYKTTGSPHEMACTTTGSTTHHPHAVWAKTLAGLKTSGMLWFDAKLNVWIFIARIPTSTWKNLQLLPIFHNK